MVGIKEYIKKVFIVNLIEYLIIYFIGSFISWDYYWFKPLTAPEYWTPWSRTIWLLSFLSNQVAVYAILEILTNKNK
jgi:hypothetical protein